MNVIQIEQLTRDYGSGKGIFGLSFQVHQGEVFGFLGPNGAGKTTAIRHLMGFIRPKSGTCSIHGVDCWTGRSQIQKNLGYIPGEISFFEDMTGADYLMPTRPPTTPRWSPKPRSPKSRMSWRSRRRKP